MDPLVSVVIPTRGRPEKLRACLDRLSRQSASTPRFEVIVSLDGPCDASSAVCADDWAGFDLVLIEAPREGIAVAKNCAIEASRGRFLLLINDDILPEPGFVSAHAAAHAERASGGSPEAMILGHSPWLIPDDASLFDRLLAQSSMVFFYDQMISPGGDLLGERDRDWGYRHAWNLNLSVSTSLAHEAGGFCPAIANCCYEDLEFAWRVNRTREQGVPVLFRPEALAPHDHLYKPEGFLERERRLGYSAFGFAKASPACAEEVFGLEIDRADELAYAARFLGHEGRAEQRLRDAFGSLTGLSAEALPEGDAGSQLLKLLEQQQVMLRRIVFRRGLIEAAEGAVIPGLFHPADGLPTRPPLLGHAPA